MTRFQRAWPVVLLTLGGCSTAPVADFLDWVAPARLGPIGPGVGGVLVEPVPLPDPPPVAVGGGPAPTIGPTPIPASPSGEPAPGPIGPVLPPGETPASTPSSAKRS